MARKALQRLIEVGVKMITYIPNWTDIVLEDILENIPWEDRAETRRECFMSDPVTSYTYGQGRGVRTYTSIPFEGGVDAIMAELNGAMESDYNGCFLNRYDDHRQHLGWHADDFIRMDHDHPIAVISLGEPREIWWRTFGQKGIIPPEQRQLLEPGSLLIMPAGMQQTHQHRIPKGDREMGPRVSLTFRRFV
jgi:alkylated DNA repair dioxygenase AlkB